MSLMEGIIKLIGPVTDVVYLSDSTIVFSLECRVIFAKAVDAKEYECISAGNQQKIVDVPYQGTVMISKSEIDKFCFDEDILSVGGLGAKISEIRRGHQVEVYVHWRRIENCDKPHTVVQSVVVVDQVKQLQKLGNLVEQIAEKIFML